MRSVSRPSVLVGALLGVLLGNGCPTEPTGSEFVRAPVGTLTFAKHIAPIVYESCSDCHRPGEAGPFPLLSYSDVRKRARQIVRVTASRYMPPWLPEAEPGEFLGQRRLDPTQLGHLAQWVEEGCAEGDPADLPPLPQWTQGWQIGEPDLVLEMPEPYLLEASGEDVFRNFVLPVPVRGRRYVRAVELRPENPAVVHHAVMMVDETRSSRRLDEKDPIPGFGGMVVSEAHSPDGFFLGWTPGKVPYPGTPGMAWSLDEGTDFVLNLHMPPSGKEEWVGAKIGFFFSEEPPRIPSAQIRLGSSAIDIPSGEANYEIRDDYVLPVPVEVHSVYPHAHYLGKEMKAEAISPDGKRQRLLHIQEWDFNWQDEYRFRTPISLPAGTKLTLRYSYDNSEENVRNPHFPPKRVVYGPQSSDEMGDLWVQIVTHDREALEILNRDFRRKDLEERIRGYEMVIEGEFPEEERVRAHNSLGKVLHDLGRDPEALSHLETAVRMDPDFVFARNNLGTLLLDSGQPRKAREHFEEALARDPTNRGILHYNLGRSYRADGKPLQAMVQFRKAIAIRPDLDKAHNNLGNVLRSLGKPDEAVKHFEHAVRLNPESSVIQFNLGRALCETRRFADAVPWLEGAVGQAPKELRYRLALGEALQANGEWDRAVRELREAEKHHPNSAEVRRDLRRAEEGKRGVHGTADETEIQR